MPPASLDVTDTKLAEATAHLPVAPEIEAPAALVE
jgi:hypothetical protein